MLSLDSPKWEDLRANGDAMEIPLLIRRLQHTAAMDEFKHLWLNLWETIFHQYDVYTASYAALPHLVDMVIKLPHIEVPFYAGSIGMIAAVAHREHVDCILPSLQPAYITALQKAAEFLITLLPSPGWGESDYTLLCGALAAVQGYPILAINLLDVILRPEELFCPNCETFFPTFGYQLINEKG